MRLATRKLGPLALLAWLAAARSALAQTQQEPEEPPFRPIVFGFEYGFATGSHGTHEIAPAWGVYAGAYPISFLRTEITFHRAVPEGNEGEKLRIHGLTAAGELHPFSDFFIDPYLLLELGWGRAYADDGEFELYDRSGLGYGGGVGVDGVILGTVAAGLQYFRFWAGEAYAGGVYARIEARL